MKRKIFYNKPFEKAIGNLLFHYNFLYQLSYKYDLEPVIVDTVNFLQIKKTSVQNTFLETYNFKREYINKNFIKDDPYYLNFEKILENSVIKLKPPFLGEVFFDNFFVNPNKFFKVEKLGIESDVNIVAHFRGGDFALWNQSALLSFNFYKNCLEDVLNNIKSNEKITLKIISDDYQLESLNEFYNYAKRFPEISILIDTSANFEQDFVKISNADIIFCTPSTFCIWASFLGNNKIIYHSREWVTERALLNDIFWVRLNSGNTPYDIKLI
jgi:hypothetical protein